MGVYMIFSMLRYSVLETHKQLFKKNISGVETHKLASKLTIKIVE